MDNVSDEYPALQHCVKPCLCLSASAQPTTHHLTDINATFTAGKVCLVTMVQASWAQQQTRRFFEDRSSPSQAQCDQIALSISGASKVSPVDNPGSLSYTVICNDCPGPQNNLIVSFREPGGLLDDRIVRLAKEIHGDLVPESVCRGVVEGSDPPLSTYCMPNLRGSALVEVQSVDVDMSRDEEAKHEMLIRHLAR